MLKYFPKCGGSALSELSKVLPDLGMVSLASATNFALLTVTSSSSA